MNRLQKKCLIAATGFHLFLLLILFIGPAFFSSSKTDDLAPMDVIPWKTVDALVAPSGGNPAAKPPVANPEPPTPTPPAPTVVSPPKPPPEPVKEIENPEPPKVTRHDPDPVDPKPDKPKKPDVSTKIVKRKPDAQTDVRAKEQADASRKAAQQIRAAAAGIRNDVSANTTIDYNPGPGGGGEAYANYAQVVKAVYDQAWTAPDDTANDDAITKVTVTIASDGTVLSARIISPSGDAQVDKSVQRTLDRVTFIRPFPEGSTDKQRTYTINFNLKAKRLLG